MDIQGMCKRVFIGKVYIIEKRYYLNGRVEIINHIKSQMCACIGVNMNVNIKSLTVFL